MERLLTYLLIFERLLSVLNIQAQIPTISAFSPGNGPVGTTVTIAGTNFNPNLNDNVVFFGATRATVTTATTTILTATVPSGASYQNISVTNLASHLTAYSSRPFMTTFPSIGNIAFTTPQHLDTPFPYSILIADIDGDNKPDLIAVNTSDADNSVSVFRNTSSAGSISFATHMSFATGSSPISVATGDIDGDGRPDLAVVNRDGNNLSILRNTSSHGSISFAPKSDFNTGTRPLFVAIWDADGDGRPDLAVANNGSSTVSMLHNNSLAGSISFAVKMDLITSPSPQSVSFGDIDGDDKHDLAVTSGGSSNTVSVFRNTSEPGVLGFATKVDIATNSGTQIAILGDIDGDNKPDLLIGSNGPIAANGSEGKISILHNVSFSGSISFAAAVDISIEGPHSIVLGDVNGDAKPDIVAGSRPITIPTHDLAPISVFRNSSASGNITSGSFAEKIELRNTGFPFSTAINDLDGDNKPDLVIATPLHIFRLSIFQNTTSSASINANLTYLLLSSGTLSPVFASGVTVYSASVSNATTFITVTPVIADANAMVKVNGVAVVSGSPSGNIPLNVGTNTIAIIITAQDGVTTKTYTVTVIRLPLAPQTITFPTLPSTVYGAADLSLVATASSGLTVSYTSDNTAVATIVSGKIHLTGAGIAVITATQPGDAVYGAAIPVSQMLTVSKAALTISADNKIKAYGAANPVFTVTYSGFVNNETSTVLTTQPTVSTTATVASVPGQYPITANGAAAANYSISYVAGILTVSGTPADISFTQNTLFENQPAGAQAGILSSSSNHPLPPMGDTFTYSMTNGTGGTDNALFSISGNKILTAAALDYEQKASYSILVRSTTQYGFYLDKQFTITIHDVNEAPTLGATGNQVICYTQNAQAIVLSGISPGPEAGQTTALSVSTDKPAMFSLLSISSNSLSYRLNTGVTGVANITVTVKDNGGTANGGTDTFSRVFTLTVNALPVISISSDTGTDISKGLTAQLTASGGSSYSWASSTGIISGQNSSVLTVRPAQTTTYTVTVTNAFACSSVQSITINVAEDYKTIDPANILTPNGDGKNDKWNVKNIDMYPNNTVKIYDRAGRLIYSKKGYSNDWDGTYKGRPLAEDSYYYVIDFGVGFGIITGFISIVR